MGTKITFVIGGARSGKSSFALHEASRIQGKKAFIATAEALDDEMRERIRKHKTERGSEWDTFEEPLEIPSVLSEIKNQYSVIVLDCLTLWLSNLLVRAQSTDCKTRTAEDSVQMFIDKLRKLKNGTRNAERGTRLFIVSNEVGMGIVPDNELSRRFRDLAGRLNRMVAEVADEVYMVTAGIPIKIKDQK